MVKKFLLSLILVALSGCIAQADIFSPPSPFQRRGPHAYFNNAGGNVGIGSLSPGKAVDVIGTVRATAFVGDGTALQGIIVLWSGTIASIPTGWELSDGSCAITCPDLRNLFIVGANADASGIAKSTVTGSALQTGGSVTISQANLPSYSLTVPASDTNGDANHQLQGTTNGSTALNNYTISSGGSGTAYTQPFYALAYIIKD